MQSHANSTASSPVTDVAICVLCEPSDFWVAGVDVWLVGAGLVAGAAVNDSIVHVENIPTMQFFQCVWDFQSNALWDTH